MAIEFKKIQDANSAIKTTDIKGKEYAEVNQRIKAFRMVYPYGIIDTQILSNENGVCIIKAMVGYYEDDVDGCVRWLGTGHAYEKENSSFINKTSYIENCETSAIGRALGMAGFGIDTSVASAEEVKNAQLQQEQDQKINKVQESALRDKIKGLGLEDEVVIALLQDYNYKKLADIQIKDYMKFVKDIDKYGDVIEGE